MLLPCGCETDEDCHRIALCDKHLMEEEVNRLCDGGQGRSAEKVRDSATAAMWCFALAAIILLVALCCSGCRVRGHDDDIRKLVNGGTR